MKNTQQAGSPTDNMYTPPKPQCEFAIGKERTKIGRVLFSLSLIFFLKKFKRKSCIFIYILYFCIDYLNLIFVYICCIFY